MNKPALFVGSSSEGLDLARAVRALLDEDAEVTLWKEGLFDIGSTFIDSLIKQSRVLTLQCSCSPRMTC